jgi:hypothetical protein
MRTTCTNLTVPRSKREFANLAQTWLRLADDLERNQALLAVTSES